MEWVNENSMFIAVTAIIIIAILVFTYNNRRGLLKKAALYAVSKAEETWGSKTGRIKFAEVYTYLAAEFPVITFFFTETQLTEIIEESLKQMKGILATKMGLEAKEAMIQKMQ